MRPRFRTPTPLGLAVATVLALALGSTPALATPSTDPGPDPVPALVAGTDTATPQLVTGLAEPAPGNPAAAALAHLASHPERYRIVPGQLAELTTDTTADGRRTVRFQQHYSGIPVLGGQYLVHLTGDGTGQRVEAAGGKYFTGLTAPTSATVPDTTLRTLALGSLSDQRAPARPKAATAEDHGQLILPGGGGRLVRHYTVRGTGPDHGPLAREVYLDATTGTVALAYDARTGHDAGAARTASGAVPATGTAPDVLGRSVKVNIGRLPDGSYQLTDLTRPSVITTYDAAGRDLADPTESLPVSSPGPDFPASVSSIGAAEAHLNAAAVYDFYHDRLGRNGLDGKGGAINSVVNVTADGAPYAGAGWDGQKMVYGNGNATRYPYAAALDVAGHEMTHAVIKYTAGLTASGQSGVMDEAFADYFGNAIDVTTRGLSMDDPQAALLGERLCRTGTPQACADRRMDDRRTTVDNYIGAGSFVDQGGVHLNSPIFSGALWDIRRTLDPLTADRLVYRALSGYLTPLDKLVDGRNAVLAAGREMKLTRAQLRSVAAAFDAHGIRDGWQNRIPTDSRLLQSGITAPTIAPAVAAGHWVMTLSTPGGTTPPALYTGSTTAADTPTRLSPDDGRRHSDPATDGASAVWLAADAQDARKLEVMTRSLSGGPVRSLFSSATLRPHSVQVSGPDIAFLLTDDATGRTRVQLSRNGAPTVELPLPEDHGLADLTLKNGKLGWIESWTAKDAQIQAPTVYSVTAGQVTAQYVTSTADNGPFISATLLAGGRLLWTETPFERMKPSSIRSGALDGSGVTDVLPATSPYATRMPTITASDQALTFTDDSNHNPVGGWTNAALPKIWQLPITGGTPERLSCNRGSQSQAAADQGTRVVWFDATLGRTDLVSRNRPAAKC
ncbi:M4 family metallopeptidase [Kitasatospora sp. NPDC101801]|uniref:M4 family metallopeptidase n=1 Tax=Kitasatospora sp. NPDC101801 TaxID=3364103 RepID=UPI0037FC541B